MRKIYLLPFLLMFAMGLQAQEDLTPRGVWCEMTTVDEPNAKEFQKACSDLLSIYPTTDFINKNPIKRKIFLNKMRGILKRGANYTGLSPAARTSLAETAVKYCNDFLEYEKGQEIKEPADFKRGGIAGGLACAEVELTYSEVDACYADGNYMYIDCMVNGSSKIQKFWCSLKFVAVLIECDQTHKPFK